MKTLGLIKFSKKLIEEVLKNDLAKSWVLGTINEEDNNLFVKIRSMGKLIKAKTKLDNSKAEVVLTEDEPGVSPGQACVFYSKEKIGDKVLGGGWIDRTDKKF